MQDIENDLIIQLLNDKGEVIKEPLNIKPFLTNKPISSSWEITLHEIPNIPIISLRISGKSPSVMFRDLFVHLDL
jgi:hypothetical protein